MVHEIGFRVAGMEKWGKTTHHHLMHQDANHIRQGLARVEQQDIGVQTDPDPGVLP